MGSGYLSPFCVCFKLTIRLPPVLLDKPPDITTRSAAHGTYKIFPHPTEAFSAFFRQFNYFWNLLNTRKSNYANQDSDKFAPQLHCWGSHSRSYSGAYRRDDACQDWSDFKWASDILLYSVFPKENVTLGVTIDYSYDTDYGVAYTNVTTESGVSDGLWV